MTHRDVILLWSVRADFARAVGVSENTAAAWWNRRTIPAQYWLEVVAAANSIGHSEVTLLSLCQAFVTQKRSRNTDNLRSDHHEMASL